MWKVARPKRWHLILSLVISLTVYGLVYVLMVTGEAYEYARDFVQRDPRMHKVTGAQRDFKLKFWNSFSATVGDKTGDASLTLRVYSDSGFFDVPLELRKADGKWSVLRAKAIDEKGNTAIIVE